MSYVLGVAVLTAAILALRKISRTLDDPSRGFPSV